MTDIVAILRTEAGVDFPEGRYLSEIMDEAADEIERLRKALGWIEDHSIDPIVVRKASAALKGEP